MDQLSQKLKIKSLIPHPQFLALLSVYVLKGWCSFSEEVKGKEILQQQSKSQKLPGGTPKESQQIQACSYCHSHIHSHFVVDSPCVGLLDQEQNPMSLQLLPTRYMCFSICTQAYWLQLQSKSIYQDQKLGYEIPILK